MPSHDSTSESEQSNTQSSPERQGVERGRAVIWRRWHIGALLAHVGLSIFFTWPLALNLLPWSEQMLPGVMLEDRDQNLWNLWWVRHAVLNGQNPFVTDFIWYPTPVTLYYHTLNAFNGLLAIPLLSVFSLPVTYNIVVMFSFVMGGYGAFRLVHYCCGNRWSALVGSVVFAYSAYHIATMRGLLQLISLEWVPFFVLFLLKAVYEGSWLTRRDVAHWTWRRALPAGFTLFLVSLVDWYYTMYSLMLAGLLALYVLARSLWARWRAREGLSLWRGLGEPWARIGVCIAVYLLLVSPILIPTLGEMRSSSYMNPGPNETLSNSADLMAFFQPARDNKLWGRHFTNRRDWPFGNNRYEVYLTYTALFLAGVGLFATKAARPLLRAGIPRRADLPGKWFWAVSALLFFLLALGPVLQVNGRQVRWVLTPDLKLPMPYALIQDLPVVSISRSPDRFDMPLTLCLGVVAGYGVNALANAWRAGRGSERRGALIAAGAIAAISLELAPMPYVHQAAPVPAWYRQLGGEQGDFSILELPPQDEYWHGAFRMYYQTAHEKRIFGGYISREFPHPFLESTPGYRELTSDGAADDIFADGEAERLSALALYRTRYVVLQKDRLLERNEAAPDLSPSRQNIERVLPGAAKPIYEDGQLEVYAVPTPSARVPFLSLGEGWEPVEEGPNGTFRWTGARATLRVDAPAATQAFLTFRAAGLGAPRRLLISHGETTVLDSEVGPLQSYRAGPLSLPLGTSTLVLSSVEGTVSPSEVGAGDDPRQLGFAFLDVRLELVR